MAGHRHGVPRRREARPGRDRRPARAGAPARRGQGRHAATSRTASREAKALLDRFNELAANYSDETAEEFADAAGEDRRRRRAGTSTPSSTTRWTRCACPPADADVTRLSGGERRRVALCRLLLRAARPAAARRADQPPRRRVGRWLERHLAEYAGHRRRGDPRSLLPGQRRRLDPRARPRPRPPLRGQLLQLARAEAEAPRAGGEAREGRAAADDRRRARLGAPEPEGPPDQAEGAPAQLRGAASPRSATSSSTRSRSTSPPGRGWATSWSRPRACARASATGC